MGRASSMLAVSMLESRSRDAKRVLSFSSFFERRGKGSPDAQRVKDLSRSSAACRCASALTAAIDLTVPKDSSRARFPGSRMESSLLPLSEMPLFLSSGRYINVPLEPTYQEAYRGMPGFWRDVLEGREPA